MSVVAQHSDCMCS